MNKFECLHETPIRAAIELLDLVKNHDAEEILDSTKRSPYASTSIAKIASNMTLVFPCMFSNTLHIDTDMMIMKAIERKCAVMLQILFSAYQVTDVQDAQEFISRFHSNIRLNSKATVDDFIALGDALSESTSITVDRGTLSKLSKDFRENCYFVLEDDIAPTSIAENYMGINEKKVYSSDNPYDYDDGSTYETLHRLNVANRNRQKNEIDQAWNIHNSENAKERGRRNSEKLRKGAEVTFDNTNSSRSNSRNSNSGSRNTTDAPDPGPLSPSDTQGVGDLKAASSKASTSKFSKEYDRNYEMDAGDLKNMAAFFSSQILDSDVKKANELVPTTMVVNFTTVNKSGRAVPIQNVVIGIKARMIPVDSDDIVNHILTKLNDKNFVLQLIRATTREISFFKDFIFAVDNAKIEALSRSKRGSTNPMWKVLERRAKESRLKRFIGIKGNNANAITTLIISQEEVDYVRKNYNKNFDSMKVINTLLDAYNLMGFVIVDESLEIAKFKFDDGDDMFETLSFSVLEKEAGDNSYKKIVNLMTKLS